MSTAGYAPLDSSREPSDPELYTTERVARSLSPDVSSPSEALRRVPDVLPLRVWLVTAIEACDKFAFFGLAGPLQNYLQNPRDDSLRPGAIGLGQAYATAVNQAFTLWCFATPIAGAIVADQRLGRLRTIIYASIFYLLGLIIVFVTSFTVFDRYVSALGLFVAMLLVGIGTGGIRPNVNSLVAEQYRVTNPFYRKLGSGETVIVDPNLTVQRIFLTFLFCVNTGALSAVATTTMEHKYGFSVAFALPTVAFAVGLCVVCATRSLYHVNPPKGSVIIHATGVIWTAIRNGRDFESAKSRRIDVDALERDFEWDDDFVDEVHQAVRASQVFAYFPIFWTAYSQMLTNFVSQAGTMETHGIPNDVLTMIDPVAIIVFIPTLELFVFPWLRKMGMSLSVVARITSGFVLCSLAMVYAAFVQKAIYSAPPCFAFPRASNCMGGRVPNNVHVLVQVPGYISLALSEILISFTGLEHAYTNAPQSMKSVVMSMFISTYAVGSLLAMAITPFTHDPNLVPVYSFLGFVTFIVGVVFWQNNKHHSID